MIIDEKFIEILDLLKRIYAKYPKYVSFDFILSTDSEGKKEIRFNIYTPEIKHNYFYDTDKFIEFLNIIVTDGIKHIRINILEEEINNATKNVKNHNYLLEKATKELKELK